MPDFRDFDLATRALADPLTAPANLAEIALAQPQLRADVAVHPRTYPALLDWLAQYGGPQVAAAVAERRGDNTDETDEIDDADNVAEAAEVVDSPLHALTGADTVPTPTSSTTPTDRPDNPFPASTTILADAIRFQPQPESDTAAHGFSSEDLQMVFSDAEPPPTDNPADEAIDTPVHSTIEDDLNAFVASIKSIAEAGSAVDPDAAKSESPPKMTSTPRASQRTASNIVFDPAHTGVAHSDAADAVEQQLHQAVEKRTQSGKDTIKFNVDHVATMRSAQVQHDFREDKRRFRSALATLGMVLLVIVLVATVVVLIVAL